MIILLPIIAAVIVWRVALYLMDVDYNVPEPFGCGTDEVCYCEKSKDCIKKR